MGENTGKKLSKWPDRVFFHCPACKTNHAVNSGWQITGSEESPTITPSVLTTGGADPNYKCHLFVKDGKIEYCNDCSHDMKGQTVDMVVI